MTSSLTRSSARAESGRSESRPGVSPRESISEKKVTALNAVAFFVELPPQLQACRSPLLQRRIESAAERCCGRDRCHSGGFLLRIMPPSWHPAPACTPRLRCRRAILSCCIKVAASILKSEPESKNRCSLWDGSGENHAVIPNSGPEIKNHCTLEGVSRQKPAVIPKSGLEIKNRCIGGVVAFCRRNHSPSRQRRMESDADLVAATAVAGGTIFLRGSGEWNRKRTS